MELDIAQIIRAARGEIIVDTLFVNGKIINVFSGETYETEVAVHGGHIVGFGDYRAKAVVDVAGKYLCPGFMDGHMHLESSMIDPVEFARTVVPRGTTTVIVDPHEIANVRGIEGIRYILRANKVVPLDIYAMIPSCVPATSLETSGACLSAEEITPSFTKDRVLGLGELMDYPGVLRKNPHVLKKMQLRGVKRIDGHAPGVRGKDLYAYIAAGALSDHECTTQEEALEKLRLGMYIMMREGSVAKDLEALLPLVNPLNMRRCLFVTDDREPLDLFEEGHMNFLIRKALSLGLDPKVAISLATINTAEYFDLKNVGAIAPGYLADLLIIDNLRDFNIHMVFKKGTLVAVDGKAVFPATKLDYGPVSNTVNLPSLSKEMFALPAQGGAIWCMGLVPNQIITQKLKVDAKVVDGRAVSDTDRDVMKICVIERHNATGNIGRSFVKGFNLKKGAIAATIAHDSHNLIVLGTNDDDMILAAERIRRMQGGLVAVAGGTVLGELPLPIGGLMSDQPLEVVKDHLKDLNKTAQFLGTTLPHPFITLSFLALPVIPELKLTDKGLVDVEQSAIIPPFVQ
jgi:adenine deaminase